MEQRESEFLSPPMVTRYDVFSDRDKPVNGPDIAILLEVYKAYAAIRVARGDFADGMQTDILDEIHSRLLRRTAEINGKVKPR
jgi:hypothetical protein